MKRCTACHKEKSVKEFSRRRASPDGLAYKCKPCDKAYRFSRGKKHYQKLRKRRYEIKAESEKAAALSRYRKNRSAEIARHAEYMRRTEEQQKKYRNQNRHKIVANVARRRAALDKRCPPWLNEKHLREISDFYLEARRLSNLNGQPYHVDHVVPLRGANVSGLHVPWNLQVIEGVLNVAKSNVWE